jgi:hypothetical protein
MQARRAKTRLDYSTERKSAVSPFISPFVFLAVFFFPKMREKRLPIEVPTRQNAHLKNRHGIETPWRIAAEIGSGSGTQPRPNLLRVCGAWWGERGSPTRRRGRITNITA